jgi:hypothetical protein
LFSPLTGISESGICSSQISCFCRSSRRFARNARGTFVLLLLGCCSLLLFF